MKGFSLRTPFPFFKHSLHIWYYFCFFPLDSLSCNMDLPIKVNCSSSTKFFKMEKKIADIINQVLSFWVFSFPPCHIFCHYLCPILGLFIFHRSVSSQQPKCDYFVLRTINHVLYVSEERGKWSLTSRYDRGVARIC